MSGCYQGSFDAELDKQEFYEMWLKETLSYEYIRYLAMTKPESKEERFHRLTRVPHVYYPAKIDQITLK